MKIIPAIDIIEGKCVRLTQGDYSQKSTYYDDPLEIAKIYEDFGLTYLHVVDLDGAKAGEIKNQKALEKICSKTNLHVDFGGGIKTNESLKIAFESGAKQITAGSIAVKNPEIMLEWLLNFGKDKIILGADAKDEKIAINGWLETSKLDLIEFLNNYSSQGLETVICTDISKDGMLQGPSTKLYQKIISSNSKINLIASGGISSIDDLIKMVDIGCHGTILGKAIYEKRISLKELADLNLKISQNVV
jgi:phosphoribosylformimino-5-aminoimidazole carboxamide ribotide isomerase